MQFHVLLPHQTFRVAFPFPGLCISFAASRSQKKKKKGGSGGDLVVDEMQDQQGNAGSLVAFSCNLGLSFMTNLISPNALEHSCDNSDYLPWRHTAGLFATASGPLQLSWFD